MIIPQIVLAPPGALLSQATQTFNSDIDLLGRRGYQAPSSLLQRVIWNVPTGQTMDSFSKLPVSGKKTIGDAGYFGFDSRLLVRISDELRFVPGRYGVSSAVKLEPAQDTMATYMPPANLAGIDPALDMLEPGSLTGASTNYVQRIVAVPTLQTGVTKAFPASNLYGGKLVSISASLHVLLGTVETLQVRTLGFNSSNTEIYETVTPLTLLNNRYVAMVQVPAIGAFGNQAGFETETISTYSFEVDILSSEDFKVDLYGMQIEQGAPTSMGVRPISRGADSLEYRLPDTAPRSVSLVFWGRFPLQATGVDYTYLGAPDATVRLSRLAATPLADNQLNLILQTDVGQVGFVLNPTTSFLDERSHLVAISLTYVGTTPVCYINVDGHDLGDTDDGTGTTVQTRRYYFEGPAGATWATDNLLHFAAGTTHCEVENPVLLAGPLDINDLALLAGLVVPIQSQTATPSLATGTISDWQVFAIPPGATQIDLAETGLRLIDVLVDDVDQFEGVNYTYNPAVGIIDFNDPALGAPGPIEGLEMRVRFAAQAFSGDDAYTLGGRRGISADDPAVGTPAAANRYIALDQFGKLPLIIGQNAADFVRVTELGLTVAQLQPGSALGTYVLKANQRPIATVGELGCVKVGSYLAVTGDGTLNTLEKPVWYSQIGAATTGVGPTEVLGVAKLSSVVPTTGWAPNLPKLDVSQFIYPNLNTGEPGMVRVKPLNPGPGGVGSLGGNGITIDADGFLDLSIDDTISKTEKGWLNGSEYEDRVATLESYPYSASGNPPFITAWHIKENQRPIAKKLFRLGDPDFTAGTPGQLGCIIVGDSLKVGPTGLLNIERLGLAATAPAAWNSNTGSPGVATLDTNAKLSLNERPVMDATTVGMAKLGFGLQVNAATLAVLYGNGLGQDGTDPNKLIVNLATNSGLEFNGSGQLQTQGPAGFIPADRVPGVTDRTFDWSTVQIATLTDGKLTVTQRPIAAVDISVGGDDQTKLGEVKIKPDAGLGIDSTGMLEGMVHTQLTVPNPLSGANAVSNPGVVKLGHRSETGLFINDYGALSVAPTMPDYSDYNVRQERNLAASLVGRFVTYAPAGTIADATSDQGSTVVGLYRVSELVNGTERISWKMQLAADPAAEVVISYRQLTMVPTTNARGYIGGIAAGASGGDGATLDRILNGGIRSVVRVTTTGGGIHGTLNNAAGCGFLGSAYFFGGMSTANTPVATTSKVTPWEDVGLVTSAVLSAAKNKAAAGACLGNLYITGGSTSEVGGFATNTIERMQADEVIELLSETLAAPDSADATSGRREQHFAFSYPFGVFVMGGLSSVANAFAPGDKFTKIAPDGQVTLQSMTMAEGKFIGRAGAAATQLGQYGYIAGGKVNSSAPVAPAADAFTAFRTLERVDPWHLGNRITAALLLGQSDHVTDSNANRSGAAAVTTGEFAYFTYDASPYPPALNIADPDNTTVNVLDQLSANEVMVRLGTTLSTKRSNASSASVAG